MAHHIDDIRDEIAALIQQWNQIDAQVQSGQISNEDALAFLYVFTRDQKTSADALGDFLRKLSTTSSA